MHFFSFEQQHKAKNRYGNGTRLTFCSRRLADLILKKSKDGEWLYNFFKLQPAVLSTHPGYETFAISNHGLVLLVKY